jgi:hypothetical protein
MREERKVRCKPDGRGEEKRASKFGIKRDMRR